MYCFQTVAITGPNFADRKDSGAAGKAQANRPSWVAAESASAWDALLTHYGPLLAECNVNEGQLWAPWANGPTPEAELPAGAAAKLNAFQRILIIQVTAPTQYLPNQDTSAGKGTSVQSVSSFVLDDGLDDVVQCSKHNITKSALSL